MRQSSLFLHFLRMLKPRMMLSGSMLIFLRRSPTNDPIPCARQCFGVNGGMCIRHLKNKQHIVDSQGTGCLPSLWYHSLSLKLYTLGWLRNLCSDWYRPGVMVPSLLTSGSLNSDGRAARSSDTWARDASDTFTSVKWRKVDSTSLRL